MISQNVIQRTFQLKFNNSTGSCFVVDFEGKQYFITAKHVIATLKSGDIVEISYNKGWSKYEATLIGHSTHSDISVFSINLTVNIDNVEPTSGAIFYGQDVYFLGFPYGMKSDMGTLNNNYPVPLVKKAIVSNFLFENPRKVLLLDGHNNPGFSGGPVVFKNSYDNNNLHLVAIISGYRFENVSAYQKDEETDIQIRANTGIIISHGIEAAIELIKLNPVGRIM